MLPKANRLKHRQDFNAVYQSGTRRSDQALILIARKRVGDSPEGYKFRETPPLEKQRENILSTAIIRPADDSPTRIGISISQKVSKLSVVRNRLKRQIRAAMRELLPRIAKGWDIVLVVRPAANQCNYRQFLQKLEQLLAKAEVLHGH